MSSMRIVSRADAVERGLTRYFTGKPCIHGHIAERQTSNKTCVACMDERGRRARLKNPGVARERAKRWYEENKGKARERIEAWQEQNKDRVLQYGRKSKRKNVEKIRAHTAWRRAMKSQRTPIWVDRAAIDRVYKQAKLAEAATGLPHHVDHIVPLLGQNICGLHVPWNLQVLEASENLAKGNRYD